MKISSIIAISLAVGTLPIAVALPAPQCADGIDNDGDGGTDWLGTAPGAFEDWDLDCGSPLDNDEGGGGPCAIYQPVHTYGSGGSAGGRSATVTGGNDFGVGVVTVTDTNASDCNNDGVAGDWDGDLDAGVGGGAFGYGAWALDPDCNYGLNTHGGNVVVNDFVFGGNIGFVVGEDDQSGPIKIQDPSDGSWICTTSGSITPCPSDGSPCGPTDDPDDCLSVHYTGTGATCGTGGGDGLYWVFLDGAFVSNDDPLCPPLHQDVCDFYNDPFGWTYERVCPPLDPSVCALLPGNGSRSSGSDALGLGNPPTSGTITAF